ncbi:Reticulon-like protein B4 [Chlorella vulgaris]
MASTTVPSATPARTIRLPVKDPRLEELLLWRDQKRSALVLGVISAGFGVVQFAKINAIQSAAYLLLAAVLGCFLWNQVAGFTHKPPVPLPRLLKEGVSEAQTKAVAEKATLFINKGLAFVNRLAGGRDPTLTFSVATSLYLVGKLSGLLSILGLAYALVVAAFTLPKVYELKQDEIDAAINKGRTQFTSLYDKHLHKVVSKIPRSTPARPAESSSRKEE